MAVKTILYLSAIVCLVASITCPVITCESLGTNVCGTKISASSFKVNENGCEDGYYCEGSLVSVWSQAEDMAKLYSKFDTLRDYYETLAKMTTLQCTQGSYFKAKTSGVPKTLSYPCLIPNATHKFKNGKLYVSCSSELDCEIISGQHMPCSCALNSESIGMCTPSPLNEDLYETEYQRDCGANHTITDTNTALYWATYGTAKYLKGCSLGCVDIFAEIKHLQDFQAQITTGASYDSPNLSDGSMTLAQGILGLLAFTS